MEQEFNNLKEEFQKDYPAANTQEEIESLRVKYLGRKSTLAQLFPQIPKLNNEEKSRWGRQLNSLKQEIDSLLQEKSNCVEAKDDKFDLTFPAYTKDIGATHILSGVSNKICAIFKELGFGVIEGQEIEDEWHNFAALNIPLEHPSRDVFDTFYLDLKERENGKYLLRSHTSPSQIRVLRKSQPPVAVISPGRVYRPDDVDAAHSFMFHQIEGFVIDRAINFSHLKGVLLHFARNFFSSDVKLRFRPHFFPFTEPSAEVDVSCIICKKPKTENEKQKDKNSNQIKPAPKCGVCKDKGWLEILGCGMIHPNVLQACKIDPKKYKGFAFGMGVERIAMLRYRIDDIRLFYDNDVRFLEQFIAE